MLAKHIELIPFCKLFTSGHSHTPLCCFQFPFRVVCASSSCDNREIRFLLLRKKKKVITLKFKKSSVKLETKKKSILYFFWYSQLDNKIPYNVTTLLQTNFWSRKEKVFLLLLLSFLFFGGYFLFPFWVFLFGWWLAGWLLFSLRKTSCSNDEVILKFYSYLI